MNAAGRGRCQPQALQRAQISVIQPGAFAVLDHKASSALLNLDPDGIKVVQHAADPPLDGSALHTVGQAALDRLDIRIFGAVPLGNEAAALKVDGDAAKLRLLFPVAVPGLEVVIPVLRPADLVQAVLDGAVCHIGNGQAAHLLFCRVLQPPFQILRGEGLCESLLHFFWVKLCHDVTSC